MQNVGGASFARQTQGLANTADMRPRFRPLLESEIEGTACARILRELGLFSVKLARTNEAGYPDRMFILPQGRVFFIEFKRPGKRPDSKQALLHARLHHFGHYVETHDTIEGAVAAVARALATL